MTTAQAISHTAWKATAATRAAALADIDVQLDNVKACVRWLVGQGIYVQDVRFTRDGTRPRIRVSASPLLHAVFKDDCAAGQHWDALLGRTMHDFKAVRYECSVCWSEVHQ
jgi:hypothetical protein